MDSQRLDLGWVVAGIVVLVSFVFDFVGFLECEESSLATLFFFRGDSIDPLVLGLLLQIGTVRFQF